MSLRTSRSRSPRSTSKVIKMVDDMVALLKKWCKTRTEELLALADTIKMLNDDDALELFKKTLPGASAFLQVQVSAQEVRGAFLQTAAASTLKIWSRMIRRCFTLIVKACLTAFSINDATLIFRVAHCAFAQCIAFCAVVVLFLYCTIAIVFAQYYLFILGSTLLRHCCSASFVPKERMHTCVCVQC